MMQNPLTRDVYTDYSEAFPTYSQVWEGSRSKIDAYGRIDFPQQHAVNLKQEGSETLYYLDHLEPPSFELAMPLPRANGRGWLTDHMAASSGAFSCDAEPDLESNRTISGPPSVDSYSLLSMCGDTPFGNDGFINIESDPDTIYLSSDAIGAVTTNPIAIRNNLDDGSWFSYSSPCFSADGLPEAGSELWQTQFEPTSDWSRHRAVALEGIISPQLLSLCVPPSILKPSTDSSFASSSKLLEMSVTSESFRDVDEVSRLAVRSVTSEPSQVQTIVNDMSQCKIQSVVSQSTKLHDAAGGIPHPTALSETSQGFPIRENPSGMPDPTGRVLRTRRRLQSAPKPNLYFSSSAKNARVSSKIEKKRPVHTRPVVHNRKMDNLRFPLSQARHSGGENSTPRRPSVSVGIEKEDTEGQIPGDVSLDPTSITTPDETEKILQKRREAKDKFLIEKRKEGMSYKTIRIEGNFSEAESTLRGRVRSLTKPKDERVRRPVWHHNDVG